MLSTKITDEVLEGKEAYKENKSRGRLKMPVADKVHIQGGKHSQENMTEVTAYLFQQRIRTVSQIWSSWQESFMVLKFHWCNFFCKTKPFI